MIRKAFSNGSAANNIFQKTQLSNIVQLGGFVYSDCLADLFPLSKMINSVANLFEK